MLHPSQQGFYGRALLPTPQENSLFVEQASCLFFISIESGSTEMLHHSQQGFYGRALLPTPQENSLFVEQASCLFFIMVPLCEFNLP
jgi:hypothetical protein